LSSHETREFARRPSSAGHASHAGAVDTHLPDVEQKAQERVGDRDAMARWRGRQSGPLPGPDPGPNKFPKKKKKPRMKARMRSIRDGLQRPRGSNVRGQLFRECLMEFGATHGAARLSFRETLGKKKEARVTIGSPPGETWTRSIALPGGGGRHNRAIRGLANGLLPGEAGLSRLPPTPGPRRKRRGGGGGGGGGVRQG